MWENNKGSVTQPPKISTHKITASHKSEKPVVIITVLLLLRDTTTRAALMKENI